jgi:signal transduction histidine kinase
MWPGRGGRRAGLVTHLVDIIVLCSLLNLTNTVWNNLFLFSFFVLFAGTVRWGWRGTLSTWGVVIAFALPESLLLETGVDPMITYRARTRIMHVSVLSGLLVYYERYEARIRAGLQRLASWPRGAAKSLDSGVQSALEHAAEIARARQAVAVWKENSGSRLNVARWDGARVTISTCPASECEPVVAAPLTGAAFLCGAGVEPGVVVVKQGQELSRWQGTPVHSRLVPHLKGGALASAPFAEGNKISGRLFLVGVVSARDEVFALTEIMAGEVGARLEELHLSEQLHQVSIMRERLRVARDLHDGILQSLTGIRLRLQNLADDLADTKVEAARRCLFTLEEALAVEQRELRVFIEGLKVSSQPEEVTARMGLAESLNSLRQRIALEWKVLISVTVAESDAARLPRSAEQVVPLIVHEAVVNALRHATPSWVDVNVQMQDGQLRLVVSNDGRGFPFRGRYDQIALERARVGPVSLRERVTSLGGSLTIDSRDSGSIVEIALPIFNREGAGADPISGRR